MKTEEFKQILGDVKSIEGMNPEKAVDVALTLVQESGKDKRTEIMKEARLNNNSNGFSRNYSNGGDKPATKGQIKFLKDLGVLAEPGITIKQASELIEANKGKGK